MSIEFDAARNARNVQERGLPFDMVRRFDFDTAAISLRKANDREVRFYEQKTQPDVN